MKHGFQFYVDIFSRARQAAWHHKEVWLIAALAGIANTGTVLETVFRFFYQSRPETITFSSFGTWLKQAPTAQHAIRSLLSMSMSEFLFVFVLFVLVAIAFAIAIFGAQQLTIVTSVRAANSNTPLPPRELIKTLSHVHALRLALLNGLGGASLLVVFGACAFLLEFFATGNIVTDLIGLCAVYLLALPVTFALNLFTMLSVVECVRKNEGILAAITAALKALRHHWLMGLEIAAGLFLINIIASAVVFACIIGVTFSLSILAAMAVNANHVFLAALLSVFSASMGVAGMLCFGGFMTLFNYTIWTQFLQAIEKKSILPVMGSVVKSILSYVPRPSLH